MLFAAGFYYFNSIKSEEILEDNSISTDTPNINEEANNDSNTEVDNSTSATGSYIQYSEGALTNETNVIFNL